ncbi:SsgA family sporulation/cell division regulator [Streptomyces sp. NPDC005573]|uniref:SsgA family sporulation/cell division regulator n=1 Tax=unclassified Streptomyces TaxID=2593676 RepID=UPI0033B59FA6
MDILIEQSARAHLLTVEDREVPVPVILRYTAADPLAVFVDFPPEATLEGGEVTWTFARSLLDQGLRTPAGCGDVRIWPFGRTRTVVEFHAPGGLAMLRFPTSALRRFLLCTYAVVGAGSEDVTGALEQGLSALFGGV